MGNMPAIPIHTELARIVGRRAEWDAAEVARLIAERYGLAGPTTSAAAEAIGFVGRNVGKSIGSRHIDIEQHAAASVADVLN